jgi:hypothetical protein
MQESLFRRYLASRLSTQKAVNSYVTRCNRLQRELRLNLDTCDLSDVGLSNIRAMLQQLVRTTTMTPGSMADCLTAARTYAQFRGR